MAFLSLLRSSDDRLLCSAHEKPVSLMMSSVAYTVGCEECIREQFADALERALKESRDHDLRCQQPAKPEPNELQVRDERGVSLPEMPSVLSLPASISRAFRRLVDKVSNW